MAIALLMIFIFISIGFYIYIKVTHKKYRKYKLKSKLTGFEVSRAIMDNYELNNVYITESKNQIISKYDSSRKVVRLTDDVFDTNNLVSCAISSIEASHAILDKKKDKTFVLRENLSQFINILLVSGYIITLFGCFFGHVNTIIVGLAIIDLVLLYNLVFYSVEKKAISIAIIELSNSQIISKNEIKVTEKLLKVTSFTTIASIIFPVAEVIKRIVMFGDSNK